jgi:hypothetical protein
MVRVSFSKCSGFLLAFARGLRRWQLVAVHVDMRFPAWWQCALAADYLLDLFRMAASAGCEKP